MKVEKVNDNLIWTEEGFGNSAAINLGTKVFVIDSMLNWNLAKTWRKLIEDNFDKPIFCLILTHAHDDHVLGNQIFKDVPIIACSHIREIMVQKLKVDWRPDELKNWDKGIQIVLPTFVFDTEFKLFDEENHLIIKVANGHTLGSSYLWEPKSKTLIAGDLVFNRIFPYGGDPTCDLRLWQKAMEELISLDPKIIISGHGPMATKDDLKEINSFFLASLDFIESNSDKGKSPDEIINSPNFPDYYSEGREERKKDSVEHWVSLMKPPQT
ncbi:MAG: MBL fold metallo-hydrolase [Promethearchaeota archaeon]|jgi:glyoxylase-like metal-dependent hydrolase (beta-lactamase superfamily II)